MLAALEQGQVVGWNDAESGQLGPAVDTEYEQFPVPIGLRDVVEVEGGQGFGLARDSSGAVYVWGRDGVVNSVLPAPVSGLPPVVDISAGAATHYGVASDGVLWGWGSNIFFGFATDAIPGSDIPIPIPAVGTVTAVSTHYHTLAVRSDGAILSWGHNAYGQLGRGTTSFAEKDPLPVPGLAGGVAVVAEGINSYALLGDGTVWAWGLNDSGQLGDGTTSAKYSPVQVVGLTDVVRIAAGPGMGFAIRSDGTVWGWGAADGLGRGSFDPSPVPVQMLGVNSAVDVAANHTQAAVVLADGTLLASGGINQPQYNSAVPVPVPSVQNLAAVDAGTGYSLGLSRDGSLWGWGLGKYGQLGQGNDQRSLVPVPILPAGVVSFAAGPNSAFAVEADGTLWSWGWNGSGQLGDGTTTNRYTPVRNPFLSGVKEVASGSGHSVALLADGSVWTWGVNAKGQLGTGDRTDSTTPLPTTLRADVVSVAAGDEHTLALKSDGSVWAWGSDESGQIGTGWGSDALSPVAVPGLGPSQGIAAGGTQSWALARDGSTWSWGWPSIRSGSHSVPGEVAVLQNVTQLSFSPNFGYPSSYAVTADGTLWAWGANTMGQLGTGGYRDEPMPVALAAPRDVTSLAASGSHVLAVLPDGSLAAWGLNIAGGFGNGTASAVPYAVPFLSGQDVIPGALGNVLRAARSGDDVRLVFEGVPASLRRVFRDGAKGAIGTTGLVPDVLGLEFVDPGAAAAGGNYYYALKELSLCSLTPGP